MTPNILTKQKVCFRGKKAIGISSTAPLMKAKTIAPFVRLAQRKLAFQDTPSFSSLSAAVASPVLNANRLL